MYFDSSFFSHLFLVLERGYAKIICSAFSGFLLHNITSRQVQCFGLDEIESIKYLINVITANICIEPMIGHANLLRIPIRNEEKGRRKTKLFESRYLRLLNLHAYMRPKKKEQSFGLGEISSQIRHLINTDLFFLSSYHTDLARRRDEGIVSGRSFSSRISEVIG